MDSLTQEENTPITAYPSEMASNDIEGIVIGIPARCAVLIAAIIITSFHAGDVATLTTSLVSIAYVAFNRQQRLAYILLAYLAAAAALYFPFMYLGVQIPIFIPLYIIRFWNNFAVISAFCVLVVSPPGMISATLSKLHCPKKVILGVLVMLRFFPTFSASWARLRDALRKRGFLEFGQIIKNPLATYERIMVPTLATLIESTDQLTSSAITRAAEAPVARTSYYSQPFGMTDLLCIAFSVVLCCTIAFTGKAGL